MRQAWAVLVPSPRNASAFSSFTTICSGVCFENFLIVIHSARPQAARTTQNNPLTTNGPKKPDPSIPVWCRRRPSGKTLPAHAKHAKNGVFAPAGRVLSRKCLWGDRAGRILSRCWRGGPTGEVWASSRLVIAQSVLVGGPTGEVRGAAHAQRTPCPLSGSAAHGWECCARPAAASSSLVTP